VAHAEVILVRDGREVSLGSVGHGGPCELGLVDDLARLQLAARRQGWSIRLRHPSCELAQLLTLAGLADVIPTEPPIAPKNWGDIPSSW
jgi:hypothetical protein